MARKKIICYVLVYDQVDIIRRSLESLVKHADRLDIVVIENPSRNSKQIQTLIEDYAERGLIKRFYCFKKNITSRAYDVVLEKEQDIIKQYDRVVVTDGDVISGDDWITEELRALRFSPALFCIGITFNMSNLPIDTFPDANSWIPPDISRGGVGYREAPTGMHCVMFRTNDFLDFLAHKTREGANFLDGNIRVYVYDTLHRKWGRTKKSRAVHLTWDLYHDLNHPYTKLKTGKSFHDMWYHQETSSYVLKEYD